MAVKNIMISTLYQFKTEEAFQYYLSFLEKGPTIENKQTAEALKNGKDFTFSNTSKDITSTTTYSLIKEN